LVAGRRVHAWLDQQNDDLMISDWVVTEYSAALSIKLRTQQLIPEDRAEALAAFSRLCTEALTILPVATSQFRAAALLADQYALGLRAGDALHVAVCADQGATLCTLDRRLAQVGGACGVKIILV